MLLSKGLFSVTLALLLVGKAKAQGCSNTCPPINFGQVVPSLCEGDNAADFADTEKVYSVCHPLIDGGLQSFSLESFRGSVTVLANHYVGCNAGRRESGIFAHVAQRYYDEYGGDNIRFITSLKGGSTCEQWANMYQQDAVDLYPDSTVQPRQMPLTVLDQEYELRDDFFTTPFGHPSYVILDADLNVRHKFIGPCCGYESYYDCTPEIAKSLDDTLSEYLDALLAETATLPSPNTDETPTEDNPVSVDSCSVTEYSEWSDCSVTCGTGIQFRFRTVVDEGSGAACPAPVETRACSAETECDEGACIEEFGSEYTVAAVASGFAGPRDVAFHPTPGFHLGDYTEGRTFHPDRGNEAWIVNGLNHSISIVASLGDEEVQTTISRRDRGYYHYMINATALAFNTVRNSGRSEDRDSFNYWAVCNDNRNNYLGTKEANNFMGPTLYNSDPKNRNLVNRLGEVCGVDEECFFLHADMLHESPDCIGIAHDPETTTAYGTVFWVFDSLGNQENGQLVRFDFQQPHGPGSMDHSVAAVRRFPDVRLTRGPSGVHAGMVVHPVTRELFIAEPGANRIVAVHADSGAYARTAREEYPIYSNRLPSFEYSIWECPEQRVFARDIDMPSGLALSNDGDKLFVAERTSGDIMAFEVASGSLLSRISTGLSSIAGMSMSPDNVLHFVDETTNALYAVTMSSPCDTALQSRASPSFTAAVEEAKQTIQGTPRAVPFSLYRDYTCRADPVVPDFSFFDQVHLDTGYASDNPDVQSPMAGMDAEAALLANRTDCEPDSDLNFDALLLGGYYCHQCLPGSHGAECDSGGECTNVQWLGYTCDNEYVVTVNNLNELELRRADGVVMKPIDLVLKAGVTYRFTIRTDEEVCITNSDSSPLALPGNDSGCAARGPLIVPVTMSFPEFVVLSLVGGSTVQISTESDSIAEAEGEGAGEGANTGLIVGIVVPVSVLLLAVVLFLVAKRSKEDGKDSAPTGETSSKESSSSLMNKGNDSLNTTKDSFEEH